MQNQLVDTDLDEFNTTMSKSEINGHEKLRNKTIKYIYIYVFGRHVNKNVNLANTKNVVLNYLKLCNYLLKRRPKYYTIKDFLVLGLKLLTKNKKNMTAMKIFLQLVCPV